MLEHQVTITEFQKIRCTAIDYRNSALQIQQNLLQGFLAFVVVMTRQHQINVQFNCTLMLSESNG
jgi:hypothetical protein